jgi:hypothetical protein
LAKVLMLKNSISEVLDHKIFKTWGQHLWCASTPSRFLSSALRPYSNKSINISDMSAGVTQHWIRYWCWMHAFDAFVSRYHHLHVLNVKELLKHISKHFKKQILFLFLHSKSIEFTLILLIWPFLRSVSNN